MTVSLDALIARATALGHNGLSLPRGEYELRDLSIPFFRNPTGSPTKDLNFQLVGAGPDLTTIIGIGPHDIFNLNNVARVSLLGFTVRHRPTTNAPEAVNGFSLTNGCKDILIQDVHVEGLPAVPDGPKDPNDPTKILYDHYNGGKAFSLQPANAHSAGIRLLDCVAYHCPVAFGVDCVAGQDASLQMIGCEAQFCDAALSLSCTADTTNPRMNCYVDRLQVTDCCRLLINGRYGNTGMRNIQFTEQTRLGLNPFAADSPFKKNFGENHFVVRGKPKQVVLQGTAFTDRPKFLYDNNGGDISQLWWQEGL